MQTFRATRRHILKPTLIPTMSTEKQVTSAWLRYPWAILSASLFLASFITTCITYSKFWSARRVKRAEAAENLRYTETQRHTDTAICCTYMYTYITHGLHTFHIHTYIYIHLTFILPIFTRILHASYPSLTHSLHVAYM